MKKSFVLIISTVLILAMMFSVFSVSISMNVMAKTLKDNPVPLAGGEFFNDGEEVAPEETPLANPKTGDNMPFFMILTGILLSAAATAGIMKKSRAE